MERCKKQKLKNWSVKNLNSDKKLKTVEKLNNDSEFCSKLFFKDKNLKPLLGRVLEQRGDWLIFQTGRGAEFSVQLSDIQWLIKTDLPFKREFSL